MTVSLDLKPLWLKSIVFVLIVFVFQLSHVERALSASEPEPDPFTPFASASEYASPPYGIGENGILYFDYGSRYNSLGKYNNPTFVASYANALYRDYLISRDEGLKDKFIKQVDYLISSSESDSQGSYWPYPFDNHHYAAPSGWYSGMTSGRVLGVLSRAHYVTKDSKYLEFAKRVLNKLSLPMEVGGMTTSDGRGLWIEEVAHSSIESYKVLNGHIFGLSGLLSYANYTSDPAAIAFAERAIEAVTNSLGNIDSGFMSYYSENVPSGRLKFFAERGGYNVIHVSQMLWLYSLTGLGVYLEKAMRFQGYEIFEPKISASFSTNAKTNGPDRMNMTFGNNYWSSYKFPVDIEMDLGREHVLQGFVILGHTPESSPMDYYFEVFNGKAWKGVARSTNNSAQRPVINFTHDVVASSVRLRIFSDNGNRSVALDGVGLLLKDNFEPLIDFANYTSSVRKLFDSDPHTGILIKNSGFIVLPSKKYSTQISVKGDFINPSDITIHGSNDLAAWDGVEYKISVGDGQVDYRFSEQKYKFYKLDFSSTYASRLGEVGLL